MLCHCGFHICGNNVLLLDYELPNKAMQYYIKNGGKPVYLLSLDASKAFARVSFDVLVNELIERKVCLKIMKLLLNMYSNQTCDVQ